ncbi:right-handed parallel beta-helix repeat-containing protein [Leifsonia sp. 22587]|uniref:right-handed parallel beta-helix repeat-containing protein n=1 Tax=Leifsonia sp. 22587 TaxID=3453946 RepID=UPI003F8635F2
MSGLKQTLRYTLSNGVLMRRGLVKTQTTAPPPQPPATVKLSTFAQSGDSFLQALGRLSSDTVVDLEGTVQTVNGFTQGRGSDGKSGYGIYNNKVIGFYNGTVSMVPGSSTDAATINALVTGDTNNFSLMRLGRGGSQATTPYFSGTLASTNQGSNYNGLILYYATNATVENSTILGFQGSSGFPPGETFPLNNYHSVNTLIRWVTVDGQGIGASGLGNNYCTSPLVQDSTFKNMGYGAGVTHYLTTDPTYERCTFSGNHLYGANFEKVSGTITLRNCTFSNNRYPMCVDTDGTSAVVNVYDPIWDGMNSGVPFKILRHNTYAFPAGNPSPPNKQNVSDFHIFQNGVEVTSSVLQVVTN